MRTILTTCFWFVVVAYPLAFLRGDDEPADALPLLTESANRFGPSFELVTLDIAGENARLELPVRVEATDPSWSPDGRKLLSRCGRWGLAQAHQFDVDRGEETNLTKTTTLEHEPTWSPDGKRILVSSERMRNLEIFVMNADGSNPFNLTNNPAAFDCHPAWSPDGKKIAFASLRMGIWRLYVMNADGSNVRDLLGQNLANWMCPSWSPDGSQILYAGPVADGSRQLFVVNADGKAPEVLTDGPGLRAFPVWSADERYIAYVVFDEPISQSQKGGTLMVYDLETLTHTPIAPQGMRCGRSRITWKPKQSKVGDDVKCAAKSSK